MYVVDRIFFHFCFTKYFYNFLFFDDDSSNIEPTTSLGVTMVLLDSRFGLDLESVLKGLTLFDEKKKSGHINNRPPPGRLQVNSIFNK
jgi:hypothetical protein